MRHFRFREAISIDPEYRPAADIRVEDKPALSPCRDGIDRSPPGLFTLDRDMIALSCPMTAKCR